MMSPEARIFRPSDIYPRLAHIWDPLPVHESDESQTMRGVRMQIRPAAALSGALIGVSALF
ncbi:hypothetical protein, partial [Streptomyces sp. MnatMP-M27]|uniref:hypothetical protein n=1 Tax=Streptomyces sp. MnatMP-M27 TaxID=1839768 RepID=UPI001C401F5E